MSFGVVPPGRTPPFAVGALVGCSVGVVVTTLTYGSLPPFISRQRQEDKDASSKPREKTGKAASFHDRSIRGDLRAGGSIDLSDHPALKHGVPGRWSSAAGSADGVVRVWNEGMVTSYDARTRNPRWVLERLTRESVNGGSKRKDEFSEDSSIPGRFRARLADYRRSGFDRGHLAPAADFKSSDRAMAATFSLANISPQVGVGFNRDYWARVEKYVRDLVKSNDVVTVVTGPLWVPVRDEDGAWRVTHGMIGDSGSPSRMVAIPTHFFKAVLAEKALGGGKGTISVACFAVPNAIVPAETPLARFAVPLHLVEEIAGLPLFPRTLSDDSILRAEYTRQELATVMHDNRLVLPLPPAKDDVPGLPAAGQTSAPASMVRWKVRHLCDLEIGGCTLPPMNFWEEPRNGGGVDLNALPPESHNRET